MASFSTFIGVFLVFYLAKGNAQIEYVVVETPVGLIQGFETYTDLNNTYYSFQKIPYAVPPVGDLRFKAPLAAPPSEGVINELTLDVTCYALGDTSDRQSEDCLYLNVFTPKISFNESESLLPVDVYIYGGGFVSGEATTNAYGPDYFMNEGIVVVTFNYRTAAFGWLSTLDDVIPGNYGLKDQRLALQWVYDNILNFGGDPNRITIHGQSSGSVSALLQLLNPANDGILNGAIGVSASAINGFANQIDARDIAFNIGRAIDPNFNSQDSNDLLQLLLATDARTLNSISFTGRSGFQFAPVIEVPHEEAFISEKMYQLFKNGSFVRVPVMLTFDSEECLGLQGYADWPTDDILIPSNINALIDDDQKPELLERIIEYYTNGIGIKNNETGKYRYCSDNLLIRGILKLSELTSKYVPTYLYRYDFVGIFNQDRLNLPGLDHVGHADENPYLWGTHPGDNVFDSYPEADNNNHKRLLRLISNFVKEGNPTPEPDEVLQNIYWPTVNSGIEGDFFYLNIANDLSVGINPRSEMYQFWKEIYDSYDIDDLLDTY